MDHYQLPLVLKPTGIYIYIHQQFLSDETSRLVFFDKRVVGYVLFFVCFDSFSFKGVLEVFHNPIQVDQLTAWLIVLFRALDVLGI